MNDLYKPFPWSFFGFLFFGIKIFILLFSLYACSGVVEGITATTPESISTSTATPLATLTPTATSIAPEDATATVEAKATSIANLNATATAQAIELENLIMSAQPRPTSEPLEQSEIVEEIETPNYDIGKTVSCVVTEHLISQNFEDVLVFDTATQNIWPGSVIQGSTLGTVDLSTIDFDRRPAKISIEGLPSLPIKSIDVENPTKQEVEQAINKLLPDEELDPVARVALVVEKAYSFNQALLSVGASASWLPYGVEGDLSYDKSNAKETVIVKFVQPYYTVSFDTPQNPTDLFQGVPIKQAERYIYEGNPPAYISSVTYGRMLIATTTSTRSAKELEGALKAYFFGGVFVSPEAGGNVEDILQDEKFQVIALGGSSSNAMKVISANDFKGYFEEGAKFSKTSSPGVPISYRANYLINNQAVALSGQADYRLKDCIEKNSPPVKLSVNIDKICTYATGDTWGQADIYFDLIARDHHGDSYLIKEVPRDSNLKNPSDPGCKKPLKFNNSSKIFQIPEVNGSCFNIYGEFWDKESLPFLDKQVGVIDQQYCFENGSWDRLIGSQSSRLANDSAEWEVFYTVKEH